MNLQPLYDVKGRLEAAAIAGTGLLGEDFRLQRAAEGLKPLAAASPVFGKIDAGLDKLLSAPAAERSGLLLDVLALVDAVVYTQAKTGGAGELEPLPAGNGGYQELSYGQLSPLLTALTTTGGGRMEIVQSAWENHPEFFTDFRVLPAVVTGLGDSYGELAELNAKILKGSGSSVLSLLKEGFDPAGKKEMSRRVEVVSAIEGAEATPWLREVLPQSKKEVRAAVITALGRDADSVPLLLELAQTERGTNRDAVLTALAKQDGAEVAAFWEKELAEHSQSVKFLEPSNTDWAIKLVTAGLRERLEKFLDGETRPTYEEGTEITSWCWSLGKKDSPVMLEFWRWTDSHMEEIDRIVDEKDRSLFFGVKLTDHLRDTMRCTGPGPLRDYCLTLFDRRPEMTRYLHISVLAALLSRPAAEVFEKFSPYILTEEPAGDAERQKTLNTVLLRALGDVWWHHHEKKYVVFGGQPTAEPLDIRWIERFTRAVYTDVPKRGGGSPFACYWEDVAEFDLTLMRLVNPEDETSRRLLIPYLQKRLEETGSWNNYSRYLLQLGGSPGGVLGKAIKKGKQAYLYYVWQLLSEAAKTLPASEVGGLCQEVLDAGHMRKEDIALSQKVLPWTIQRLQEGAPFPEWDEWWSMRK